MVKDKIRIDFPKNRFGVNYYQYKRLDCVDVYMEMLILMNCKFIGKCRSCTHLLKWVVKILYKKWDNIRFIDIEESFSLSLIYRKFVKRNVVLEHFEQNRHLLKLMSYRARKNKNHYELIHKNIDFFSESLKKYIDARNFIYNGIKAYIDIYNVNDFKNDLDVNNLNNFKIDLVTDWIFFVLFSGTVSFQDFLAI